MRGAGCQRLVAAGFERLREFVARLDHRLTEIVLRQQVREIVQRERATAEHVHRVMRAHDDAIVAVFGGARDHLRIALRHEHREHHSLGVAIGRVAAGIGGAVSEVLRRPVEVFEIVGGRVEVILALEGEHVGLGLERARVAELVRAFGARRQIVGFAEQVGDAADVLDYRRQLRCDSVVPLVVALAKKYLPADESARAVSLAVPTTFAVAGGSGAQSAVAPSSLLVQGASC